MNLLRWLLILLRRLVLALVLLLALGLFAALGLCVLLFNASRNIASHPAPAASYDEAVSRFDKLRLSESTNISPLAKSILMTHGGRTSRVVVFFHGYSSSPRQFQALGEAFFEKGYNVLIPRLPYHGIADRKLSNLSNIRAEDLRDCADESVDIAAGLGEQVYAGGLSAGGVLAAWSVENRKEVSRALLIAPCFVLGRGAGTFLERIAVAVLAALPGVRTDFYANTPAADYAYPGFSAKSLAELLRFSVAIYLSAAERPPLVQDICLVTSRNDRSVSDFATLQLMGLWRFKGLRKIISIDFPKEWHVSHDMIDPVDGKRETGIVYPVLTELLTAP
jgi:pimeloyl-ACP methyl ester carboxylesterase